MVNLRIRKFFAVLRKSLNPRYYTELSERRLDSAVIYLIILLGFAFLLLGILLLPKAYMIKEDIEDGLLAINTFKVSADFETVEPIMIPNKRPLITFDTTDNKTIDSELLLVTDDKVFYKAMDKEGSFALSDVDFTKDRKQSKDALIKVGIFLLPSFLTFYYFAYLVKYAMIILLTGVVGFVVARGLRNGIELRESIIISIYASTVMVLIEVITIPFFLTKYLVIYTPFIGINISIVAITLYLTFYVTGVRLTGSRNVK